MTAKLMQNGEVIAEYKVDNATGVQWLSRLTRLVINAGKVAKN
jgi:hypothetical protein